MKIALAVAVVLYVVGFILALCLRWPRFREAFREEMTGLFFPDITWLVTVPFIVMELAWLWPVVAFRPPGRG